jgi:hypothetical protein
MVDLIPRGILYRRLRKPTCIDIKTCVSIFFLHRRDENLKVAPANQLISAVTFTFNQILLPIFPRNRIFAPVI